MLSKKFYIAIIIRVLIILLTGVCFLIFIDNSDRLFTLVSIILAIVIQIVLLVNYINRFNREVASFFSALRTNDASFAFHDNIFPYISQKVQNDILHIRNQLFDITELKEIQQSYYKNVIEKAQTGIIAINENGKIDIINNYAIEILNIRKPDNIRLLENTHQNLYQFINNNHAGAEKLLMIKSKSKAIPLSIRISEFKQKNQRFKIVLFQNIESELSEKEIESFQKLIRVLTHEINNSVTPITTLANTLENRFRNKSADNISKDDIEKTFDGLHIISQRGEGLIEFVNNYRNISSLKKMNFELFKVAELFYNLELLMRNKLDEKNIQLKIDIKPIDLELKADKNYIEQIFINLIKNSIDAIQNNHGEITLKAFVDDKNKTILAISDNGIGIPEDILDQIFVPFFTTKENGSGIGLSLAQQVMKLHGGSISVHSVQNESTTFSLSF